MALHTLHTCMRATRIAMVSYFQVTLWRGFVRVMSLIDASMREGAKAKNLHPFENILPFFFFPLFRDSYEKKLMFLENTSFP